MMQFLKLFILPLRESAFILKKYALNIQLIFKSFYLDSLAFGCSTMLTPPLTPPPQSPQRGEPPHGETALQEGFPTAGDCVHRRCAEGIPVRAASPTGEGRCSPQARRGEILLLWRVLPERGLGGEVSVIFEQSENRYKKII